MILVRSFKAFYLWFHALSAALIKLARPFQVHNHRQIIEMMGEPLTLEKMLQEDSRVNMNVLGWGTTRLGGNPARELRWVEVPYVSNEECKLSMRPHKVMIMMRMMITMMMIFTRSTTPCSAPATSARAARMHVRHGSIFFLKNFLT